jgi:hypothetical protein
MDPVENVPLQYSYGCQCIPIEYFYGCPGHPLPQVTDPVGSILIKYSYGCHPQVTDPVERIPIKHSYGCQCIPIEYTYNTHMVPKGCPRPKLREGIPIEYSYGCQSIAIEHSYGTKGLPPTQVTDPGMVFLKKVFLCLPMYSYRIFLWLANLQTFPSCGCNGRYSYNVFLWLPSHSYRVFLWYQRVAPHPKLRIQWEVFL